MNEYIRTHYTSCRGNNNNRGERERKTTTPLRGAIPLGMQCPLLRERIEWKLRLKWKERKKL